MTASDTKSVVVTGATDRLVALAADINREHEAAEHAATTAVEHARRAGEMLLEAKAAVLHGAWLPWIRENLSLSERSAQGYMRVAKQLRELPDGKAQRVADLPLRQVLASLAESREDPLDGSFLGSLPKPCTGDEFWSYLKRLNAHVDALRVQHEAIVAELKDDSPTTMERVLHLYNVVGPDAVGRWTIAQAEMQRIEPIAKVFREELEDRILEIKGYGLFKFPPETWTGWRPKSYADARRHVKALPDARLDDPVRIDWMPRGKACDRIADVLWSHWSIRLAAEAAS